MSTSMDSQQWIGITSPISLSEPKESDIELSEELEQTLREFDLFESESEMNHRMNVLSKLNQFVQNWIESVSLKKLPSQNVSEIHGKVFTFGSYRLGVHSKGADIDSLIVAPRHVERSDFFTSFYEFLLPHCEYVRPIEDAFVPVLKVKIEGKNIYLSIKC